MATKTPAVLVPKVDVSIEIRAPGAVVIDAFFDPHSLGTWWKTSRSVTTSRLLGAFAVEWPPMEACDSVLGRLGGVFRGTVMQFEGTRGFFVADAFWLPPDSGPIGPMALEVSCGSCTTEQGLPASRVRLTLTGFEESARWRRFYEIAGVEWGEALQPLKTLVET